MAELGTYIAEEGGSGHNVRTMTISGSGKTPDVPRFMSVDEIESAACSDYDAQPLTEADMRRMKRTPQVEIINRALSLTDE